MKINVSRSEVWAATIEDRPGGLADKLEALAEAGANLEFIISRRAPEQPGKGVVFVAPLKGAKVVKAAGNAGFQKSDSLHSVRLEGSDKPGTGSALSRKIAEAGLNMRGFSAAAFGKRFVAYLAFDVPQDAARAVSILKKIK